MKIKRFFAKDTRTAMRQVRDALGPDAVILSNRRVAGGVEVLSAIGYEEKHQSKPIPTKHIFAESHEKSLHTKHQKPERTLADEKKIASTPRKDMLPPFDAAKPSLDKSYKEPQIETKQLLGHSLEWDADPTIGAMRDELHSLRGLLEHQLSGLAWHDLKVRKPQEAELLRQFLAMGLDVTFAKQLAAQITHILPENIDFRALWKEGLDKLSQLVPTINHDAVKNGGIMALVGPTGVGKTTTIAKLAARYIIEHGPDSVGIISLDSNRIAGAEQLKTYARILGVSFRVADDTEKVARIVEAYYDKKLILIDTPGCHQWRATLKEQLDLVRKQFGKMDIYLTLAATSQYSVLCNTIKYYQHKDVRGCIVTKLDETASLGEIISALITHDLPCAYVSDGQSVSENLRVALAEQIVSFAVQLGTQEVGGSDQETLAVKLNGNIANAK